MEKRQQLDLNAPLLSARRYSSPSRSSELVKRKVNEKTTLPSRQQSLPSIKSNCQYDDVCKPASVPFHWEQIPGKPKNGAETLNSQTPEPEPSITPRLPPGRLSGPTRFASGERSNDQNIYKPQIEAFSFVDHATLLEKLNESLQCKDEPDSESEEEDDAYSDALDTLSVSGSFSWNYSVSGISGYHSPSGVKPSGNFCIDTNTRDFMMNRFLPAAKAAVLEAPLKKQQPQQQQVVIEQPKVLFRKSVSGELKPSRKQYYYEYVDNVESEDEVQDISSKVPVKKWGKAWGIIPRFCAKNSLCLLNPIPGMKSKTRFPTPPKREVRRLTRNAHSGPLDKNACQVPQQKKFHSGLLSRDLPRIENNMTNDLNKNGVSPLRRYNRSGSISPYRNESPKSPFREGVGFLGVPKEVEDFNANKIASSRKLFKALQDVSKMNQTNGGVVEKTVYIESVNRRDSGGAVLECDQESSVLDEGKKQSPKLDVAEDIKLNQSIELDPLLKASSSPLLAPPLPKSPSESWLWRTLPSISLGNPFAHSRRSFNPQSKKQGQKGQKGDAKWETIVKTTNLRHDHVRYSQELIPHVSHRQSKS